MADELRVGIVGAGWIAGVHRHAYRACPDTRVVAVADPVEAKARRLADEAGAEVVDGLDALLALGVDVVDVCTPPQHHADLAIAALEAGAHVICEKPLARELADAQRVARAAESAAGLLMVGHVSRYEPDHRGAKEVADSGSLGRVAMVRHSTTASLPGWSEAGWLADPAQSGGPLLDQAVHSFDFARWVIGSPATRVHCVAADSSAGPRTYALATVLHEGGAIAHIEVSWAHPAARGFKLAAEVVGTEGRLTWSYDHLMGGALHPVSGDAEWYDVLGDRGFTAELADFVAAIRAGGPSPVPATEALASLRVALGALESARSGRTVDLTAEAPA